jgi:hypothetical protein
VALGYLGIRLGTEENHENFSQDSWSSDQNLNLGPPKYEADVLTNRPRRSVD